MRYYTLITIILSIAYTSFSNTVELFPFRSGNKWGFSNKDKTLLVIQCKYAKVYPFKENRALVETASGQIGFISKSDRFCTILPKYDLCRSFSESLAAFRLKGKNKWGFIDKDYNEIIKPQYSRVGDFHEGYAKIRQNDKYGYIDRKGNIVIPLQYEYAGDFSEGLAPVKLNNKYGYISVSNKIIIPFSFDNAKPFSNSLASVSKNKMCGYINKMGKIMIPLQYESADTFSDEVAIVTGDHNKFGAINSNGKFIIPFDQFRFIGTFSNGRASAKRFIDKFILRSGVIDKTGKIVIPFKYLGASWKFDNNLLRVYTTSSKKLKKSLNGETFTLITNTGGGYINLDGREYWKHNQPVQWRFIIIISLIILVASYIIYRCIVFLKVKNIAEAPQTNNKKWSAGSGTANKQEKNY